MLEPADYNEASLNDPLTRQIMAKIEFRHGGKEYDEKYPDGIPTTLEIEHADLGSLSSGLVMYPEGHARNTGGNLDRLLGPQFRLLAALGVERRYEAGALRLSLGYETTDEDVARAIEVIPEAVVALRNVGLKVVR